jgi:hypothetical protein
MTLQRASSPLFEGERYRKFFRSNKHRSNIERAMEPYMSTPRIANSPLSTLSTLYSKCVLPV